LAITDTSLSTMLFIKQDKGLPEIKAPGARSSKNKETTKADETKADDTKDTKDTKESADKGRARAASFKAVLEKEIRKQLSDQKSKGRGLSEELKQKKEIRPFYVVPKDKKKSEPLPAKIDDRTIQELLGRLAGGAPGARLSTRKADGHKAAGDIKSADTGKTAAGSLARDIAKNLKPGRPDKNNAVQSGPRLIVVDLREKAPAPPLKQLNRNKYENKKHEELTVKGGDKLLDAKDMKLFVKHTGINDGMLHMKTDFETRHLHAKQALPQFTQMQKALSAELVRQTRMIIRNGGNGEIHLVLKPESLGNVRVRVNIHDNNIVGKIFVDNNTVKEMVQGSLSNLYNAFKQDGFNQAMINVFVGSEKDSPREGGQDGGSAMKGETVQERWEREHEQNRELVTADSLVNIVL
jgi:flagellar hook-length control protein FliK